MSPRARSLTLVIEAAVSASVTTSQAVALDMLEDIERAWAVRTGNAPSRVSDVRLSSWQILDRPEGIDAVVLQILGTAEYIRSA